ncbi:MAG: hypothetical protein H7A23_26790 [Leptospiraceae bacterium]|nr:hypothetical protein [Leptospiraceae bacterium]MCP5498178.1 hypothetical protein [Leptospiraceae bacterium]
MKKLAIEKYSDILGDLKYLLINDLVPIYRLQNEEYPEKIQFFWRKQSPKIASPELKVVPKPSVFSIEKNFVCKLCKNKLSGIRSFIKKGNKPVLVLHYSGEYRKGRKAISKTSSELIFRTEEENDVFNRMIQKVFGFSFREFFYQEYPACNFNPNETDTNWEERMINCEEYVKETITKENIQAILMVGASAVLKYGKERAHELIGKTTDFEVENSKIPMIVLRSPEAVLSLEKKSKTFEKNKNSDDYKKAKNEENSIKKQIIEELARFKSIIRI